VNALIIDDSRAMRMILAQTLKQLGFQILEAANGQEGLDRLREHGTPQVVLVDWNMPVMNGYEFVRAVRSEAAWANLPIVMVTTETELPQVGSALEAGVNEYVMKPFTRETIQEKLSLLGVAAA
jgi:two-component system chemotaxis response regulator CheY